MWSACALLELGVTNSIKQAEDALVKGKTRMHSL